MVGILDDAVRDAFGDFDGRIWLNTAHQGPLPLAAAAAARDAVSDKTSPVRMRDDAFVELPRRLRQRYAQLLGAHEADVVLANSASYGLHLLVNGLAWASGDQIIVVDGDFPATTLPWRSLTSEGVDVRTLHAGRHGRVEADELHAALEPATRLVCISWVNSFTGVTNDLVRIGEICGANGTLLIVNATQGLGAQPLHVDDAPVDAIVSSGFKWLCGPYGTGVCWLDPHLRDQMTYHQRYWLTEAATDDGLDLGTEDTPTTPAATAARYDVFDTANFFNFAAMTAALDLLLEIGTDHIATHDQELIDQLHDALDPLDVTIESPRCRADRSTLVFVRPSGIGSGDLYQRLHDVNVDVALRAGAIRISPHLHNTTADIATAAAAFADATP